MDHRLSNTAVGCSGFCALWLLLSSWLSKEEQVGGVLVAVWIGKPCCLHAWLLGEGKPLLLILSLMSEMHQKTS